jgi:hypothetical protein
MVEVRVFGALWEHLEHSLRLDLEGCEVSVGDLLARLDIDAREVGIVTVDGQQSNFDRLLPASCRVCIFPLISGGQHALPVPDLARVLRTVCRHSWAVQAAVPGILESRSLASSASVPDLEGDGVCHLASGETLERRNTCSNHP